MYPKLHASSMKFVTENICYVIDKLCLDFASGGLKITVCFVKAVHSL